MTWTAWSLNVWSVARSPRCGGGPGSMGVPVAPPSGRAKLVTRPQCGPTACCTPLTTGIPFYVKNLLGQPESAAGTLMAFTFGAAFVSFLAINRLAQVRGLQR